VSKKHSEVKAFDKDEWKKKMQDLKVKQTQEGFIKSYDEL
jgi:hypothetical protein